MAKALQITKPDLQIFEYGFQTAQCLPDEAVMIGNRLDNNIAPAKAIGMKTVSIKQGFGGLQVPTSEKDAPDEMVGCLSDLLRIF